MDIKRVAVLCFLIIVLLVLLVYYFFVGKVYFELKGNHEEIIKFNEDYKDPGISAKYCTGNRCDDLSDYVTIENNVDNTKLGTYEYVYYINYQNKKYKLTRKITVIDDESPIISLKGNSEINMCPNTEYKEEGYTATDNYDKDITDKVERIVDKNRIIGTSGMSFVEKPPYYGCPSGKIGLLSSMYVIKEYRRKGIAKYLLDKVVNEAKDFGCSTVQITASDMGVLLYTDYGFKKNGNFMIYSV